MFTNNIRKLFANLGELIGIEDLTPAKDGTCRLLFDNRHTVTLIVVPALRNLVVSCPCAPAECIDGVAAITALRANFMGCGSGGGALGLSPDGTLHLQFHLTLDTLDAQFLMGIIEILLNQVEAWGRRLPATVGVDSASPMPTALLAQRD